MRTEDILGFTFFGLLLLGLGFMIRGGPRNRPSTRKPKWTATGLAIIGLALVFFGSVSSYLVHTSPRIDATGYIENLRRSTGKNAGSQFFLAVNGGPTFALHARYHGYGIQQGEMARVSFVQYSSSVLELTMLSGSTQGWSLTESEGSDSYLVISFLGIVCWGLAFREYRELPTGN